jgi:hypothetical protein
MIGIPANAPFHSLAREYEVSLLPPASDVEAKEAVESLGAFIIKSECWEWECGRPAVEEAELSRKGLLAPMPALEED